MTTELNLSEVKKEWHGTLKSYVIGFIISLILTAISFLLIIVQSIPKQILVYTLISLALAQAVIQLLFFLHLGQEAKPRWESFIFYFMLLILLIIAIGSLWIMYDLNDRVMENMKEEMHHD